MKIFLDTNVFYKNWFADNPNFKLLFYFLNNKKFELLLSDLVVQETNNIRTREVHEVRSEIDRLIKKGNKLNLKELSFRAYPNRVLFHTIMPQAKCSIAS